MRNMTKTSPSAPEFNESLLKCTTTTTTAASSTTAYSADAYGL